MERDLVLSRESQGVCEGEVADRRTGWKKGT